MPLFYNFFQNIAGCFRARNIVYHAAAIVLTVVCVVSGFDWLWYASATGSGAQVILFPAVILGFAIPIFGPLAILAVGMIKKKIRLINTAWALGQAGLMGLVISSAYKAFTGRAHPLIFGAMTDLSHEFHFGFLQRGVFWGWPSSHTAAAFAVAVALLTLYPKSKKIFCWALVYAFYVGIGVSVSIHWFSDFAAGAIIGVVIGRVVGMSFLNRYEKIVR